MDLLTLLRNFCSVCIGTDCCMSPPRLRSVELIREQTEAGSETVAPLASVRAMGGAMVLEYDAMAFLIPPPETKDACTLFWALVFFSSLILVIRVLSSSISKFEGWVLAESWETLRSVRVGFLLHSYWRSTFRVLASMEEKTVEATSKTSPAGSSLSLRLSLWAKSGVVSSSLCNYSLLAVESSFMRRPPLMIVTGGWKPVTEKRNSTG